MAHYIRIYTDSNRLQLRIKYHENDFQKTEGLRLVYEEIHESEKAATARTAELKSFTRMQLERAIRRNNPNWLNLELRKRGDYHPGAKFNPKVPNCMSLR